MSNQCKDELENIIDNPKSLIAWQRECESIRAQLAAAKPENNNLLQKVVRMCNNSASYYQNNPAVFGDRVSILENLAERIRNLTPQPPENES